MFGKLRHGGRLHTCADFGIHTSLIGASAAEKKSTSGMPRKVQKMDNVQKPECNCADWGMTGHLAVPPKSQLPLVGLRNAGG